MVGYKLSKNDWVTPFFVIFRSVREKLLVTVSFEHPVSIRSFGASNFFQGWMPIKSLLGNITFLTKVRVCSSRKYL